MTIGIMKNANGLGRPTVAIVKESQTDLANNLKNWIMSNQEKVLPIIRSILKTSLIKKINLATVKLNEIKLTNFDFEPFEWFSSITLVYNQELKNDSSAELLTKFSYRESTQNTFSFGFKEGLKLGTKASFKAGIPLVGAGEVEVSGEISFDATQQWTDTSTKEWAVDMTVAVPARKTIDAKFMLNSGTGQPKFTATATAVDGLVTCIITIGKMFIPVTFPLGSITFDDAAKAAKLSGVLDASIGLNSYVELVER